MATLGRKRIKVTVPPSDRFPDGEHYEIYTGPGGVSVAALTSLKVMGGGFTLITLVNRAREFDPQALQALVWFGRFLSGIHDDPKTIEFPVGDLDVDIDDEDPPDPQTPKTPESGETDTSVSSRSSSASPQT